MQKLTQFLKKHSAFFAVSFLLPFYHFFVVNRASVFQVSEKSFSFHAVDYSMGFCSRLFPGELYHTFVGIYTKKAVDIYLSCLYALFILLLAFLVDAFVLKFKEYKRECFVLIFLFLTGPFTFDMLVLQFGLLDFYFIFAFFVALLFLQNRFLRFAVPALAAVMVAVSYETMFSFVFLLLALLLFYFIQASDKKEKRIRLSLFLISALVSFCLAFYFLLNDANNLTLSAEEFEKLMLSRNANPDYYELFFYHRLPAASAMPGMASVSRVSGGFSGLKNAFEMLLSSFKSASFSQKDTKLLVFNAFALLPQSVLIYLLACYSKQCRKKSKKALVWIFVLFSFAFEFLGFFISSTNIRSLMHAVIMLFVFTMYILFNDYTEGFEKLRALLRRIEMWLVSLILFFYALLVLNPSTLH